MERKRARILIADDHTLVAEACRNLLEPEFEVVGPVGDGRALLRAAIELKPDLIVVDMAMPLLNGLDAGQQIKHKMPSVKLVFLTMNEDIDLVTEAFRRGASGYLSKTCAAAELVSAIRDVLKGKSYLSPSLTKDTIRSLLNQPRANSTATGPLTDRQREVMQLLAEGKSMKEAANVLNVTVRTVAFHKYRIMKVLHLKNGAELVQYAMRNHIIAA
jgi:DNA-binding NarL/FixJ family response regulator